MTLLVLLSGVMMGCASGTYPLDFFYEMHYQQSYQPQEPPRLWAPAGAIPFHTGREISGTENPIPGERLEEGRRLFISNCVFCHGETGKGDGPVLRIMREKYNYPQSNPNGDYTINPDLTSDVVKDQSDVALFAWISNGVTVMPHFDKLLSVEERWLLINYIRTLRVE